MHDLLRAAQRGDPAAMDELLRSLLPYIGRVCGAVALDRGDDAVQETCIAVLRSLRDLRDPGALRGWVRRIAVREAVRVARRDPRLAQAPWTLDEVPAAAADLDAGLDVRDALALLSPEHRAVLVLRDLDGLAEAEVAELLRVPPGTVKSRLHRARALVRKALA